MERFTKQLRAALAALALVGLATATDRVAAASPSPGDPEFATFSIAAIDPGTGEVGVAVTTRNWCVGNGVPWVRAGVGAVATQARTRVEYGEELLDAIAAGETPEAALARALAADEDAAHRQVGVIASSGAAAQHTGAEARTWAGHRSGVDYVTQGNLLEGAGVLEAVASSFQASRDTGRHLADRLIAALEAGQAAGGDRRKGRAQSAAVVVADPRPGRAHRPDGQTVRIATCEHPTPVAEIRRMYDAVSQRVGYRTLQQYAGRDVWQLKLMLHALGLYRPEVHALERAPGGDAFNQDVVDAVDAFRRSEGLATPEDGGAPPGLVDHDVVLRLWASLEAAGKADALRSEIRELTAIRR